jgi:K+-transporting ATPase ATPase B chain
VTILFLIVVVTLYPLPPTPACSSQTSTLVALAVCLIPTTIGGLL